MKNILYYYSSQQIYTGSPRVLMRLIEGLDRGRFTPFFLADGEGELSRELAKLGCVLLHGRSGQISCRSLPGSLVSVFRLMLALLRSRISLVHVNELGWNSELAVAAALLRIPVFFHIHNPEILQKRNLNCRVGAKYLFVSRALAESCRADAVVADRGEVLYNPIAISRFASGKSVRSELGLPADCPVVGTVAQVCRRKGIDAVIEVAAKVVKEIPEARFVIAGPDAIGEEAFAAEMRKRAAEQGLSGKLFFVGPREDVDNFLASLDLFFLPTRSEPFGMVFVEAMAARVPIVASHVGGIPEILPSTSYGVTMEPDPDLFAGAIIDLLRDPERRQSMSEAGYRRAKEHFDESIFRANIESLYRQQLAS